MAVGDTYTGTLTNYSLGLGGFGSPTFGSTLNFGGSLGTGNLVYGDALTIAFSDAQNGFQYDIFASGTVYWTSQGGTGSNAIFYATEVTLYGHKSGFSGGQTSSGILSDKGILIMNFGNTSTGILQMSSGSLFTSPQLFVVNGGNFALVEQ